MALHRLFFFFFNLPFVLLILLFSCSSIAKASGTDRTTYIVYMGERPNDGSDVTSVHIDMLNEVAGRNGSDYLVHSYYRSLNGFSAKLTEEEADQLEEMDGVVSVFLSQKRKLLTTRSWDFMGFTTKTVKRSRIESDIIIGVIDTGIWPESESFNDKSFGPVPKKWKGICQSSSNFTCNKKIVGARYYYIEENISIRDDISPRDMDGHGTHTASTAAGNNVNMASFEGLGLGTARGGVPSSRIAVYKVCWSNGCDDHSILKAFDDAIADGVDIISASIGGSHPQKFFEDTIAIGSFHAMKKGVLTSHAAGNEGPNHETLSSVAPWMLSVAASTIDRKFFTLVKLGNGIIYSGSSLNTFKSKKSYPLIRGSDAPNTEAGYTSNMSRLCMYGSLNKNLIEGKILLCDVSTSGDAQLNSGAVGTVMGGSLDLGNYVDTSSAYPLPAAVVNLDQVSSISDYVDSTRNPTATIMRTSATKDESAPSIASFSSRGPNTMARNILKPDISAPGVDILSAWSPVAPVSGTHLGVDYNIIFGTSMACPHATATAAYVKSFHPTWSPAALKSALMTTAIPMSAEVHSEAEFAYGSGHLNPLKARDPGLVYDVNEKDYVKFLCGQGYSRKHLRILTNDNSTSCTKQDKKTSDLNYPALVLPILRKESITHTFKRIVTNVGPAKSVYRAKIIGPPQAENHIQVDPLVLRFTSVGQKLSFSVTLTGQIGGFDKPIISTSLVWDDGKHKVRSPIVVYAPF